MRLTYEKFMKNGSQRSGSKACVSLCRSRTVRSQARAYTQAWPRCAAHRGSTHPAFRMVHEAISCSAGASCTVSCCPCARMRIGTRVVHGDRGDTTCGCSVVHGDMGDPRAGSRGIARGGLGEVCAWFKDWFSWFRVCFG